MRGSKAARGQSLAEFALCLPVLCLLLFALVQLCLLGWAAITAQFAARRAARAYSVYCQKGPGYGLEMAWLAAAQAASRLRPMPGVELELEEEGDDNQAQDEEGGRKRQALAMATGMPGLKDRKQDELNRLFTLRVDLQVPLVFPGLKKVFGDRSGWVTLSARSKGVREDAEDYFKAHPEVERKRRQG